MKHLSPEEFVDAAEGTLDAARAAHLRTCEACRTQADSLGALLRDTAAIDVPDPSPLFWDHFSARVRERIAEQPEADRASWLSAGLRTLLPLGAFVALVIAVIAGTLLPRLATPPVVAPQGQVAALEIEPNVDARNNEVWSVLTDAAADMGIEDAHAAGMAVHPAAIDRAVQRLNKDELTELGRLLQNEMKRTSN